MEWVLLNSDYVDTEENVIGCDWYPDGSEENNFRMHICDGKAHDQYWCGEMTDQKVLSVRNSICPEIGDGESAYWLSIPNQDDPRWIAFDIDKPPSWKENYHEVLILLYSGNIYTGFIENLDWCPSYNMFKNGSFESIKAYMELPEKPKYIAPPILSQEEIELREKKSEEWLKKIFN